MQLKDKLVAITGGGKGIGRAMAQVFSAQGANVALLDLNEDDLAATRAACEANGVRAGSYLCNLVFYSMMHEIKLKDKPTLAGFIHLPALPEEAALSVRTIPSLSLDLDLKAARLIVNYLAQQDS